MNAARFWDGIADRYDESVNKTYADTYRMTIERTLRFVTAETVMLDYGCGTGIITNAVSPRVSHITAIDISERMIGKASEKAARENIMNVVYHVMDIMDGKIEPGRFDTVCAFNILYFLRDLDGVLRRIHDLLPAGGMFISATDCVGEKGGLKTVVMKAAAALGIVPYMRYFTMAGLASRIAKAGFRIEDRENLFDSPPNLFIAARKI